MKKNETTGSAILKGASANVMNVFYIGEALKDFIMKLLVVVRTEVTKRKRSLGLTDEELARRVLDRIKKDKYTFINENEERKYYGQVTREVVWNHVNTIESERIINCLKQGDHLFAQKFFYGTNNNECNISLIRSKIIAQIKQTYHYEVSIEEFGNIVYTHLWDNGTWNVLDNYAKKSSFYCWLEQVSRREVIKTLEEMKVINISRTRTVGNTRLLGASIPPDVWDLIITDIMQEGLYKDLLVAALVERKTEKKMAKDFKFDIVELGNEIKKAETILKDRLIRGNSYYEELVLRDRSPRIIKVSDEFIKEFVKWQEEKGYVNPLGDFFGVNLDKEEVNEKVVDFLYRFSEKLHWSDEDKLIWRLRFIENTTPVEVAKRCGKTRAWLDARYSRLNKKFDIAIHEWWKKNS